MRLLPSPRRPANLRPAGNHPGRCSRPPAIGGKPGRFLPENTGDSIHSSGKSARAPAIDALSFDIRVPPFVPPSQLRTPARNLRLKKLKRRWRVELSGPGDDLPSEILRRNLDERQRPGRTPWTTKFGDAYRRRCLSGSKPSEYPLRWAPPEGWEGTRE